MPQFIRIPCILLCLFVALIVGSAFAIKSLVSLDATRHYLASTLSQASGQNIAIDGPMAMELFPALSLIIEDITLSQTSEQTKAPLAHITQAKASLTYAQLLARTVHVSMDDITLLHQELINSLAKTFGGHDWQHFSSASATITMENDSIFSNNITIIGNALTATGAVSANLTTQALNGEGNLHIGTLPTVPVYLKGTIDEPLYGIDASKAVHSLMQGLGLSTTSPSSSIKDINPQEALEKLGKLFK